MRSSEQQRLELPDGGCPALAFYSVRFPSQWVILTPTDPHSAPPNVSDTQPWNCQGLKGLMTSGNVWRHHRGRVFLRLIAHLVTSSHLLPASFVETTMFVLILSSGFKPGIKASEDGSKWLLMFAAGSLFGSITDDLWMLMAMVHMWIAVNAFVDCLTSA